MFNILNFKCKSNKNMIAVKGKNKHFLVMMIKCVHDMTRTSHIYIYIYMSNGLNLLHPRKDVAEMVFCVSLIVPEDVMFAIKSGEHVYQESSFFVSPLSFLRVS